SASVSVRWAAARCSSTLFCRDLSIVEVADFTGFGKAGLSVGILERSRSGPGRSPAGICWCLSILPAFEDPLLITPDLEETGLNPVSSFQSPAAVVSPHNDMRCKRAVQHCEMNLAGGYAP